MHKGDFCIMDSFIYSLNATVPVFLVMIIGNFLHRIGMIDKHFSNIADKFVFKVCLPCMLFSSLSATNYGNILTVLLSVFVFLQH